MLVCYLGTMTKNLLLFASQLFLLQCSNFISIWSSSLGQCHQQLTTSLLTSLKSSISKVVFKKVVQKQCFLLPKVIFLKFFVGVSLRVSSFRGKILHVARLLKLNLCFAYRQLFCCKCSAKGEQQRQYGSFINWFLFRLRKYYSIMFFK